MGKESGRKVLVKVGNGATPTEVFTSLAGQKSANLQISSNEIDVTDKNSDNWGESLSGTQKATLTVSGAIKWPDTAGWDYIRQKSLSGEKLNLEVVLNADGDKYKGSWSITSFNVTGEVNGATEYSITFSSGGPQTWVEAP